jgi:hypothetical protein
MQYHVSVVNAFRGNARFVPHVSQQQKTKEDVAMAYHTDPRTGRRIETRGPTAPESLAGTWFGLIVMIVLLGGAALWALGYLPSLQQTPAAPPAASTSANTSNAPAAPSPNPGP